MSRAAVVRRVGPNWLRFAVWQVEDEFPWGILDWFSHRLHINSRWLCDKYDGAIRGVTRDEL